MKKTTKTIEYKGLVVFQKVHVTSFKRLPNLKKKYNITCIQTWISMILLSIPGRRNKMMAWMAKHFPLTMQTKMNEKMVSKAIDKSKI